MKLIRLFFICIAFFLLLSKVSAFKDNSLIINDISEELIHSYLTGNMEAITINPHNPDLPFIKFGKINYMSNDILLNNHYLFNQPVIREMPNKTDVSIKLHGSSNYAGAYAGITHKDRNLLMNANLDYNLMDYISYADDGNIIKSGDFYFDNFRFKTSFNFFDDEKYLELYTQNNYGKIDTRSLFEGKGNINYRQRLFGEYGIRFGSIFDKFDLNGNFAYTHFSEKIKYDDDGIITNGYPDYYNVDFNMIFSFQIFKNVPTELFFNYYEDGLNDFNFFEQRLGRMDNERLSFGFKNEHNPTEKVNFTYSAVLSNYNRVYKQFNYKSNTNLPEYRLRINYKNSRYSNYALKFNYLELPGINISDTLNKKVNITQIAGKYSYIRDDIGFAMSLYYNAMDNISDITGLYSDIKRKTVLNNIGLNLDLYYNSQLADLKLVYNYNHFDNRDLYFFNLISKNTIFAKASKTYLTGLNWATTLNFRSGSLLYNPTNQTFEKKKEYYFINIKAGYNIFDNIELFVKINNLTNTEFRNDYYLPGFSRLFSGGVNVSF